MKNLITLHYHEQLHHIIQTDAPEQTVQQVWTEAIDDEELVTSDEQILKDWFARRGVHVEFIQSGTAHYKLTGKRTHNDMIDELEDFMKEQGLSTGALRYARERMESIASEAFKAGYNYKNSEQDMRLAAAG